MVVVRKGRGKLQSTQSVILEDKRGLAARMVVPFNTDKREQGSRGRESGWNVIEFVYKTKVEMLSVVTMEL